MTSICGTSEFRWWEGIVAELNDLDPSKATIYFPGLKTSQILIGCLNVYLKVPGNRMEFVSEFHKELTVHGTLIMPSSVNGQNILLSEH
jgi:hypothetical protein